MAIEDRILMALIHFRNRDDESAIGEVSMAIDATGKQRMPNAGVGVRFKDFIHTYRSFIASGAMGWGVWGFGDLKLDEFDDTLAKLLYYRARNPVIHEAGLDGRLEVMNEPGFKIAGASIGIGRYFILACILSVIGDPVNTHRRIKEDPSFQIGDVSLRINDYWGKFSEIERVLLASYERRIAAL